MPAIPDRVRWRKSSYSTNEGGECVEVAELSTALVVVRDSKDPDGPVLTVTPGAFAEFVSYLR
ncbi:DUF397 domain-containing protein [Streptomyces sp. NPDC047117]|uniref:DUF397 domain-containing protein n=1 Tax=Streptomyces sp. NPDC047117 TaxID=3155379 RepID=UPI0033E7F4D2